VSGDGVRPFGKKGITLREGVSRIRRIRQPMFLYPIALFLEQRFQLSGIGNDPPAKALVPPPQTFAIRSVGGRRS
jgi:hypothetical protein